MTGDPMPFTTPMSGLTHAQVAERIDQGLTNAVELATSRSVTSIVRANVVTIFNGLLLVLFLVIMATGRWQNGLFGAVIVANSAIGIIQELRAKRTLDRLAVLNTPRACAIRDDEQVDLDISDVVLDDLLLIRAGDQVPADGTVLESRGLEIDESLLTGESEPLGKEHGDQVRSGSIVVAGQGRFQATAVGPQAYATRLATEARRHTVSHSELIAGTNRLLRAISLVMLFVAPLLLWSQFRSEDNDTWQDAATGTVAALVGMVPEGLVLLTSLAFMLGTITLARRQVLVQELPAVEGLARVDMVCLDKTGTLTYGDIVFDHIEYLFDDNTPTEQREALQGEIRQALGLTAQTGDRNATATALAEEFPSTDWSAVSSVPFSSARKWSAVGTADQGTWCLGAPEMTLPDPVDPAQRHARELGDSLAATGSRVLLLSCSPDSLVSGDDSTAALPTGLVPRALIVLAERVREDAAQTLRYFDEQGVHLKVISGDNPRTVGTIAARVGIPGVHGADDAVDARELPTDLDELGDVLATHSVFGRVTPGQKRAIVAALQRRGHVVAMTGDGVNDALALKDADIGVAMGNGASATRAVAQLVLLDSQFAHLPVVVAEGRRVIANIERAANLFLIKNVYSLVLALITAVSLAAYPLAPIQLTLISTLTIGIPGFFLALGPNTRRYIPGFLTRTLRFSIPAGIVVAACAYASYRVARLLDAADSVDVGRTSATITVLGVSLWTLSILARPLAGWKLALLLTVTAVAVAAVAIPPLGHGLLLFETTPSRVLIALIFAAVGAAAIELISRSSRAGGGRHLTPQA